ncbi:MAG: aminotransferase class V-fold PLP-dependent enzyme [Acidobacteriaceae bacterium]|nr:aminotransferase class V-fold PLP-dependent enzyme [Acidobacteriaceae bacterium]
MGFEEVEKRAEPPEQLWARYRDEFPVTREVIYLNHAAVAPLCRRASQAMQNLIEDASRFGSLHYSCWLDAYAGLRDAAAKLINASPDEVAIVKNTSEGIATVAEGFDWKPGDRVVGFREEFPANYNPWARLERRGVKLTWLSIYDPIEKVAGAIQTARLLAISYVNYLSGYRADLTQIGELCRQHGCFFFVDAIQGLGAFPVDVDAFHIDALAADGHKWLLAPEGGGILYVRRKWLDAIEPVEFGWTNPAKYAEYSRDLTLRRDAGRYECGTLNTVGCFGLKASIEFLLEIGIEKIAAAVDALASRIEAGVRAKGYETAIPRTSRTGSGIVSFRHHGIDSRVIVSQLNRNRVLAAARQGWVRLAPHFYISPDEIDRVLEMLPNV